MKHNVYINGIKDINQVLQRLNGKRKKMMNYSKLSLHKELNCGMR